MSTLIEGTFETQLYATDDGLLAIEQAKDVVVLLSADQLPRLIEQLRAYYDSRASWDEATPG